MRGFENPPSKGRSSWISRESADKVSLGSTEKSKKEHIRLQQAVQAGRGTTKQLQIMVTIFSLFMAKSSNTFFQPFLGKHY